MNLTVVFIAAAVVLLWILPINAAAFSLLFAASMWLMREAHQRRVSGQAFTPLFRSMLWGAAVFAALLGIVSGVLSYLAFTDKNAGWGGVLLFFSVPICLMALVSAWVFAWYARYRPLVAAPPRESTGPG